MKFGGQIHIHRAASPKLRLASERDVLDVYEAFEREYAEAFSPVNVFPEGGVEIHSFVLRAELEAPRWELPREPMSGADPSAAQRGTRRAIWDDPSRPVETPVTITRSLRRGNRARGPGDRRGRVHDDRGRSRLRPRGRHQLESHHLEAMRTLA